MKIILCICLFAIGIAEAYTQDWGFVRSVAWGKTFWADMNGELLRGEFSWAKNDPAYYFKDINRTDYTGYVFGNAAVNFPLFSWDNEERDISVSVGIPVAFEIWMGPSEDTFPVQNTDYHIGLPEPSVLFRFNPFIGIKNAGFRVSFARHESTHISDEMQIYRDAQDDIALKRMDVASTHQEIRFIINDPDGSRDWNNSVRFGFIFDLLRLEQKHTGWYLSEGIGQDASLVEPNKTFIFYLQDQFQTASFGPGFQGIASIELRIRDRHRYPIGYSTKMDSPEIHFVPCVNLLLGIRYYRPNSENDFYSKIGLAFRYYYGINPYGQYRSLLNYQQMGICILLE
ncbi:MAG: hypothetical protein LBM77_02635 [Spirochaetaceae bacterium]|jgi:hypothetical protein|nr:hypothetical protein [Spirochaetaceae bacterium]